jgi:hypothetical protein
MRSFICQRRHGFTSSTRRPTTIKIEVSGQDPRDACHHLFQPPGCSLPIRWKLMIQFTAYDAPLSNEKDCSHRADVGVIPDHLKRTRIARPSK